MLTYRSDRLILKRLLVLWPIVGLGVGFLFSFGTTYQLLKDESLSLGQVALILPWSLPFLAPYLLPIAYLIAVALVYARLVAEGEALAFGSLGIPARSLAWPAVLLGALQVFPLAWASATLVPYAQQQRKATMSHDFQQLFELGAGEHFSRKFKGQGFSIYVRRYRGARFEGVVLHTHGLRRGGHALRLQLTARAGRLGAEAGNERLVLELEDAVATYLPVGEPPVRAHLARYVQAFALGGRRRVKEFERSSTELRARAQGADEAGRIEAEVALGRRTTLSLAPLLLTLLALPLPFCLRLENALLSFGLTTATALALFLGPTVVADFLARASGVGALAYTGIPASLLGAGLLGLLARRRT
ncbi:MAG: LptF/LptG family permease [Planctomycetota bacterium]|nr:MAG: LptF/LptG family permease [Planctomycetota bacterium]